MPVIHAHNNAEHFSGCFAAVRTISAAVIFVKSHMETWLKKGLFIYSPDPLNHDDMRKTI